MATRADVAKLAKVSPSTVSYVLSGTRSISEETRKKVLSAIKELDYRPNHAAGSLAGGRSKIIAFIVPSGKSGMSPSFVEYISGVSNAVRERGYHLTIYNNNEITPKEIYHFYQSGVLDGVVLMEIEYNDKRVEFLTSRHVPLVLIGRTGKDDKLSFVDRDFETDGEAAVNYLSKLGHTSIALIRVRRSEKDTGISADIRFFESIKKACKQLGVTLWDRYSENSAAAGRETFIKLRNEHPEISAAITLGDYLTFAFVNAANEFGIKVPKDYSILALAIPDISIELTWPALTTLTVKDEELGYNAGKILLDRLENESEESVHQLWRGELVERGTTAKKI
jgi:DNA-binding LacI/PurR family transcriptional regulator